MTLQPTQPTPIMARRGGEIWKRRKALGMSQTTFASHMPGATRQTIRRIEHGIYRGVMGYAYAEMVLDHLEMPLAKVA